MAFGKSGRASHETINRRAAGHRPDHAEGGETVSRRAARITHDEVTRMVKAVRDLGLPIGRVIFDGESVSVVIGGDIGEDAPPVTSIAQTPAPLIREPKL
jgi:hypothetical protein